MSPPPPSVVAGAPLTIPVKLKSASKAPVHQEGQQTTCTIQLAVHVTLDEETCTTRRRHCHPYPLDPPEGARGACILQGVYAQVRSEIPCREECDQAGSGEDASTASTAFTARTPLTCDTAGNNKPKSPTAARGEMMTVRTMPTATCSGDSLDVCGRRKLQSRRGLSQRRRRGKRRDEQTGTRRRETRERVTHPMRARTRRTRPRRGPRKTVNFGHRVPDFGGDPVLQQMFAPARNRREKTRW